MADYLSNQIVVLRGNGDGTFKRPLVSSAPAPVGLAVGDLNGDGNEDLLVVESNGTELVLWPSFWDRAMASSISKFRIGWARKLASSLSPTLTATESST
jgi:hypothetical protein